MLWKKAVFLQPKILQNIIQANVRNIYISKVLKKNYYEVLGVERSATFSEIKNAYFELSKVYHPDRIAATDENLAKFREISTAYEILGNEHSRKMYDRGLFGDEIIAGIETKEDISDPIIKFYKERHQRGKIQTYGESQFNLDDWTEKYYKEARTTRINKSDIFQASKFKEDEFEDSAVSLYHIFFIVFGVYAIYAINLENHPFRIKYLRFKAWLQEMFSSG